MLLGAVDRQHKRFRDYMYVRERHAAHRRRSSNGGRNIQTTMTLTNWSMPLLVAFVVCVFGHRLSGIILRVYESSPSLPNEQRRPLAANCSHDLSPSLRVLAVTIPFRNCEHLHCDCALIDLHAVSLALFPFSFAAGSMLPPADCFGNTSGPLDITLPPTDSGPYTVHSERCEYRGGAVLISSTNSALEIAGVNLTFYKAIFYGGVTIHGIKFGSGSSINLISCESAGVFLLSGAVSGSSLSILLYNFTRRIADDPNGNFAIRIIGGVYVDSTIIVRDSELIGGASHVVFIDGAQFLRTGLYFDNIHTTFRSQSGMSASLSMTRRGSFHSGAGLYIRNSRFESYGNCVIIDSLFSDGAEIHIMRTTIAVMNTTSGPDTSGGLEALRLNNINGLIFGEDSRVLGGAVFIARSLPGAFKNCRIVIANSVITSFNFSDTRIWKEDNFNNTVRIMSSTNISAWVAASVSDQRSFTLFIGDAGENENDNDLAAELRSWETYEANVVGRDVIERAPTMTVPYILFSSSTCLECVIIVSKVTGLRAGSSSESNAMSGLRFSRTLVENSMIRIMDYDTGGPSGIFIFEEKCTFVSTDISLERVRGQHAFNFDSGLNSSQLTLNQATIGDGIFFQSTFNSSRVSFIRCDITARTGSAVKMPSAEIFNSQIVFSNNELHCESDASYPVLIDFLSDVWGSFGAVVFEENRFLSSRSECTMFELVVVEGIFIFTSSNMANASGLTLRATVIPPSPPQSLAAVVSAEPKESQQQRRDEFGNTTQIQIHHFHGMRGIYISLFDNLHLARTARNLSISIVNVSVSTALSLNLASIEESSLLLSDVTCTALSGLAVYASAVSHSLFQLLHIKAPSLLLKIEGSTLHSRITLTDITYKSSLTLGVSGVFSSNLTLSGARASESTNFNFISIRSSTVRDSFIGSTLAVRDCVVHSSGGVGISVSLNLGAESVHSFVNNIIAVETAPLFSTSNGLLFEPSANLGDGGELYFSNNSLMASSSQVFAISPISGALVVQTNGASVFYGELNRIQGGALRIKIVDPSRSSLSTPRSGPLFAVLRVHGSSLQAIHITLASEDDNERAPFTTIEIAIHDSSIAASANVTIGNENDTAFLKSASLSSSRRYFEGVGIRIENVTIGIALQLSASNCKGSDWILRDVTSELLSVRGTTFFGDTSLTFETIQLTKKFAFWAQRVYDAATLTLKRITIDDSAAESEPLSIGGVGGVPSVTFDHASRLQILECWVVTHNFTAAAIDALFTGMASVEVSDSFFFSSGFIGTANDVNPGGALIFKRAEGSLGDGTEIVLRNNTFRVQSLESFIFFLVTNGGAVFYAPDNKCPTAGKFSVMSWNAFAPAAYTISIYNHNLTSVDIETLASSPVSLLHRPGVVSGNVRTCIRVVRSRFVRGLRVVIGPARGTSVLITDCTASSLVFGAWLLNNEKYVFEVARTTITTNAILSYSSTNSTEFDTEENNGGAVMEATPAKKIKGSSLIRLHACNFEALSFAMTGANFIAVLANSTIRMRVYVTGFLFNSSLSIVHNLWPDTFSANRLTIENFIVVRSSVVVSNNRMLSRRDSLISWSQASFTDALVWFDANEFVALAQVGNNYIEVDLNFASREKLTPHANTVFRFTRNYFAYNMTFTNAATRPLSVKLRLLGGRVEHDETNRYVNAGLDILHLTSTSNNTVVLKSARQVFLRYIVKGDSKNDFVALENSTFAGALNVTVSRRVTHVRISVVNVLFALSADQIEIAAHSAEHSRVVINCLRSSGYLSVWSNTIVNENVSLALLNSVIDQSRPLSFNLSMRCPTSEPSQRCLLVLRNNTICISGPDSALAILGDIAGSVHVEILNNTIMSTAVAQSGASLTIGDGVLQKGVHLTINRNTVSTYSSQAASLKIGQNMISGTLEVWGNTVSNEMSFDISNETWSFLLIGNKASVFNARIAARGLSLPVSYRIASCNHLAVGNTVFNPFEAAITGGVALECTKASMVPRCLVLSAGNYSSVTSAKFAETRSVTDSEVPLLSCENNRPSATTLLDHLLSTSAVFIKSIAPRILSWDKFLVCSTCAPSILGEYRFAYTHYVHPLLVFSAKEFNSSNFSDFCSDPAELLVITPSSSLSSSPTFTASFSSRSSFYRSKTESRSLSQSSMSSRITESTATDSPLLSHTAVIPSNERTEPHTISTSFASSPECEYTTSSTFTPTRSLPPHLHVLDPIPPSPVKDSLSGTIVAAGAVTAVAAFVPVSGGQLGVANAMVRLASCETDQEADDVPILVHPLRFSVFPTGRKSRAGRERAVTGSYIAASVSNTMIIPAVVALLARGPIQLALRLFKSISQQEALVMVGWPAVVMSPFVALAEGIGVSIVKALLSGEAVGIVFGLSGAFVTAAFVAVWVRALVVVINPNTVMLVRVLNLSDVNEEGTGRPALWSVVGSRLLWLVTPLQAWAPRPAGKSDVSISERASTNRVGPSHHPYTSLVSLRNLSFSPMLLPSDLSEGTAARAVGQEGGEEMIAMLHTSFVVRDVVRARSPDRSSRSSSGSKRSHRLVDSFHSRGADAYVSGSFGSLLDEEHEKNSLQKKNRVLEQYGSAVGDKRLYYAEMVSFGLSLLVGICEGIPPVYCKPRAILAALATIGQCGCNCLSFVPIGLLFESLMALCVVPMSVLVVAEVFRGSAGAGKESSSILDAIEALSLLANIFGLALTGINLAIAVRELFTIRAKVIHSTREEVPPKRRGAGVNGTTPTPKPNDPPSFCPILLVAGSEEAADEDRQKTPLPKRECDDESLSACEEVKPHNPPNEEPLNSIGSPYVDELERRAVRVGLVDQKPSSPNNSRTQYREPRQYYAANSNAKVGMTRGAQSNCTQMYANEAAADETLSEADRVRKLVLECYKKA